jgi:putative ABC transport system ATP-binding protein
MNFLKMRGVILATIKVEKVFSDLNRQHILSSITTVFQRGLIHTIIGPSGSGKSTFLRLLNRLVEPTGGDIFLDGVSYRSFHVIELRRRIGLVFQNPVMFSGTVEDNILYPLTLMGSIDRRQVTQSLGHVGLNNAILSREALSLSGGEKQRVALARALVTGPEVLLLDEATSALDPSLVQHIETMIKNFKEELGLTIIWVTHDMHQARRIGDTTLLLVGGKIIEHLETEVFFDNKGHNYLVEDFIQGKMSN